MRPSSSQPITCRGTDDEPELSIGQQSEAEASVPLSMAAMTLEPCSLREAELSSGSVSLLPSFKFTTGNERVRGNEWLQLLDSTHLRFSIILLGDCTHVGNYNGQENLEGCDWEL